ncbi:MAG: hypothetical protein E3K32_09475 [wastewater metagenome]|nr:hypothetical protein [Candidatus Loosdrechtia aerotolerans]
MKLKKVLPMNKARKINIGITFYGGISFAIYEAGMAEEFIRFIQFCKTRREELPDINVQAITGTSTGGLVALLMSTTLINTGDPSLHIQEMRRIWFDIKDLSMLQYKGGQDVHSFLNNDILEHEIKKFLLIKKDGEGLCNDLRTFITCMNMHGFFDAVPVEYGSATETEFGEVIPTIRHTEVFEFSARDIRESSRNTAILEKITKTARITTSSPAAFPPHFTRSPSFPEGTYKRVTHKEMPLRFWYLDGGWLDNKPLGHAIDYMETSNIGGEWWYFFAEPQPTDNRLLHQEWGSNPEHPPDPVETLLTVFEVEEAERIYYDLRRIQKMNYQVIQVNDLISEIQGLFSSVYQKLPQKGNSVFRKMNEGIKAARLRYLLPDYLKCITILHYRFLRKGRLEDEKERSEKEKDLKDKHKAIMKNIHLHDPRRIINECCSQIRDGKIQKGISKEIIERVSNNTIGKDNDLLMKYDRAVESVKDAQLLFRQVSFWIEDDYKLNRKELSPETWKEFEFAWERLRESLKSSFEVCKDIESWIQKKLLGNKKGLMKNIESFVSLDEAIRAAFDIQIRERINIVRIYHSKNYGSLAGIKMMNFAGLLDLRWRKNDYIIGKYNAREMLKGKMDKGIFTDNFWEDYTRWCDEKENEIDARYRLFDKDIIRDPKEKDMDSLQAGIVIPQINRILQTLEELIRKYREKPFFYQLKIVQANLMLPILRAILWLLRQAAAQPLHKSGERDKGTVSDFKVSSKRHMGFVFIGIIVGLLISFYLPAIFEDAARYTYYGIAKLVKHLFQ